MTQSPIVGSIQENSSPAIVNNHSLGTLASYTASRHCCNASVITTSPLIANRSCSKVYPTFDITFGEIEVSTRAIIISSTNSEVFNNIRSTILSETVLPEGTKMPPDITHCTLARFNRSVDLEKVEEEIGHLQCSLTEHITVFKLLKDLGPPTFEPKTIQEYSLQK